MSAQTQPPPTRPGPVVLLHTKAVSSLLKEGCTQSQRGRLEHQPGDQREQKGTHDAPTEGSSKSWELHPIPIDTQQQTGQNKGDGRTCSK